MSSVPWSELLNQSKDQLSPVPAGTYNAKIIDARGDKSSTGKLMIRVKFEILDEPHRPRKIPTQFTVSDENPMALAIFFRQMETLGLGADFFSALPTDHEQSGKLIADALMNRQCRITLEIRAWQGVDRNNVTAVLPSLPGAGPVAPGTVTGAAVPGGPTPPGASAVPTPTNTPAAAASATSQPPLPF